VRRWNGQLSANVDCEIIASAIFAHRVIIGACVERPTACILEGRNERSPKFLSHFLTIFLKCFWLSVPNDVPFGHCKFVQCRVLAGASTKAIVEVSLRNSRLEGDLDDDAVPDVGDIVQAFVVETSKKGCFLRLSRQVEGRTILKELCDGFLPDPTASFPTGRLIVGKVKGIHEPKKSTRGIIMEADIDMRESILTDAERKMQFDDLEIGSKYKGTVVRIEEYGVFVRLETSDISGLVHKSECSDKYVKNLANLFDPGDMVKVIVLKKDIEKKQVGFGMKASYFISDKDSDDESSGDEEEVDEQNGDNAMFSNDEIDSDDENYVSKLSSQIGGLDNDEESEDSDNDDDTDDEIDDSSSSKSADNNAKGFVDDRMASLDTNVGFDWSGGLEKAGETNQVSEDDSSSSDEEDENKTIKSSHKSRRKQAQRRKEEQEISLREAALADGTADESPETASDFERLLAGAPDSSELWIRYMAFHLTMANIPAAREVANRAFDRIEFRQEKEKLNVWCALLTLELKYGTDATLQTTLDRACQHNNPKHVYLRVCEMMVKHQDTTSSSEMLRKTDETFVKMCSKFRSKKTVWIAHLSYLLERGRHDEAQQVIQRSLLSLPAHKHIETLSKYASLTFTYGRAATARTVFDGLLKKYQKRLDVLFVYADQEIKHDHIAAARSLFRRVATNSGSKMDLATATNAPSQMKLNDKQMKRLFKKWYTFEELHGTEATQEGVKDAAREYVERSLK
jgi:rRNA biogenesis protein RRP5